jgi:hypothetical protein
VEQHVLHCFLCVKHTFAKFLYKLINGLFKAPAGNQVGLPDVLFSSQKLTIWVNFWRVLKWKMLVNFMAIWSIVRPFGIISWPFFDLVVICYLFPFLVPLLYQEKSGIPASEGTF